MRSDETPSACRNPRTASAGCTGVPLDPKPCKFTYNAWVREADQRASTVLAARLPQPRRRLAATSHQPDLTPSPYQVIAAELRAAVRNGHLPPGAPMPTVQQLATTHHVAPSTAHRAITQLANERLIATSRGRRATVTTRDRLTE